MGEDTTTTTTSNTSSEFFLRYAEIVNSLLVNHLHRVFSMAPAFFMTIDKLLKILVRICDDLAAALGEQEEEKTDKLERSPAGTSRKRARECANALSRIVALLRPHKTDLSKLAPYWISHFLNVISSTASFGADVRIVKDLNNCVFCLMDLVDDFGFDVLRTLLPGKEKELLHRLRKEYDTTFKFQGRI